MPGNPTSPSDNRERAANVHFNLPELPRAPEQRRALRESVRTREPEQRQAREAETPQARQEMSLEDLKKKAEKVKLDPNVEAAERIRHLDGNREVTSQSEALVALHIALISVLGKLSKKGVDTSELNTPQKLQQAVTRNNLILTLPEQTALENLSRIVEQSGPTAREVRESWPDTVEAGSERGKGYWEKYKDRLKKDPASTLALTVAGAAGIYLGYQAIKGLFKKTMGILDEDKNKKGGWFKKEIMIPLLIMGAGGYIGKEKLKEILMAAGIDYFGVKEKIKKGEEFTEEQKRRIKEGGPVVQEQIERMRQERDARAESGEAAEEEVETEEIDTPEEVLAQDENPTDEASEEVTEIVGDINESAKFRGPRDTLIATYCYDRFEFPPTDKDQMRWAVHEMRGKTVGDIQRLWENNRFEWPGRFNEIHDLDRGIKHQNTLLTFPEDLDAKNINKAAEIIALASREYQARFPNANIADLTLEEFFENHVYQDSVLRINEAVQEAMTHAVVEGDITDLLSLKSFNLNGIQEVFKSMGGDYLGSLAHSFDIKLEGVNKKDFALIVGLLAKDATLQMGPDKAMEIAIPNSSQYDPKAVEKAKIFYEKIRQRTLDVIIPKASDRFNVTRPRSSAHADIIKNHLNDSLSFDKAIQLALVTRSMNLEADVTSGGNATQELAFLFTVLHCLPPAEKNQYMGELAVMMTLAPSSIELPSLRVIKPYLSKMFGFSTKVLESELTGSLNLLSVLAPDRTEEEQKKFLQTIRHSNWFEWGGQGAVEAASGVIQVPKDFVMTLVNSGGHVAEELKHCEDPWDFMQLAVEAGATFFWHHDERGRGNGMIHFMGRYFVFRPIGVVEETFNAALEEDQDGMSRAGSAFKVYTVGAAPFVTLGAAHGFLKAREGAKGWLFLPRMRGAAHGAAKGLIFPYYGLRATGRGAYGMVQSAVNLGVSAQEYARRPVMASQHLVRGTSDVAHLRWGQNATNMMENAKWFTHYQEGSKAVNTSLKDKLELLLHDRGTMVRRMAGDFNERMALRYGNRFIEQYNDFFDFRASSGARLRLGDLDGAGKANVRLLDFFDKIKGSSNVFEEMKALARQTMNADDMAKGMREILKKIPGLLPEEYSALARQLKSEKTIDKFWARIGAGIELSKAPAKSKVLAALREKIRRTSELEKSRSFGKISSAIRQTQGELNTVAKRLATAEQDLQLAHRMRSQTAVDKARAIIQESQIAKIKLENSMASLELVRDAEANLAEGVRTSSGNITHLEDQLRTATSLAEDELRVSSEAIQDIGRFSKLNRAAKLLGRTASWAGAGVSAWLAMDSAYEAVTTDVEGRGGIKGAEALMWTLDSAAGVGSAAVLVGSTSTAATVASYAAVPLIPLTYAGSKVFETAYEGTITDAEWAQKNPYELLHHFYTSVNSASLGDAWSTLGIESRIKKSLETKNKTMRKIFKGLIAIQKDPNLLSYIQTEPASGAKNKEVQRRIEASYSIYHEFYFQNTVPTGLQSYSSAQKFIQDAQMYDDLMQARDRAKEAGESFVIEGDGVRYSLHEERYDVIGGMDHPKGRIIYMPDQLVKTYKGEVLHEILKDPIVAENLERMDSAYLVRLYVQMNLTLNDAVAQESMRKEPALALALKQHMGLIRNYLRIKRDINFEMAIRTSEYFEPRMSLETITAHLEGMGQLDNATFKKFEKEQYSMTPALHSLYKLAQYFGYLGSPSEVKLKEFFTEDAASFRGIYWNGDEWVVQEAGWESDNEIGSELSEKTITQIIKELREDPDNILEHRNDTMFVSAYDYQQEVLRMANILQSGLEEGKRFQQEEGPQQSVQPSQTVS